MSAGYITTAIRALGTDSAGATLLAPLRNYNQISQCLSLNNGVRLPSAADAPTIVNGCTTRCRNDGGVQCSVYPPTGGTINALGADVPFFLPVSGECDFVYSDALTVFTFSSNNNNAIIAVLANATLTPSENNATILVAIGGADITITLPAVANVVRYRIQIGTAGNHLLTITAPLALSINGCLTTSFVAGAVGVPCVGRTSIIFAASAPEGSFVNIYSNGVNWIADGVCVPNAVPLGFTVAP